MYILFVFPCYSSWCTLFFLSKHFSWRKSRNKITCFDFFEKSRKRRFCFAIFSMKNASTEKTKYTTTKSMEKRIKCTSPIFNFRNFVTEIFAKHFQKFSIFWKNIKRRIRCQNSQFCFTIFSMKNASTEKTKYTTTKSMEKRIKYTSPIFNCPNFVTVILAKHFRKFSIFRKNK